MNNSSQKSKNNIAENLPLSINNISKEFAKVKVLDDISFEVNKGEVFGLIGLNGAGKTTLIKIILGLLKQESGDVSIFGNSVKKTSTRNLISFLPEKFQPSIYLKGKEFLSLTLSYYKNKYDHAQAETLVDKLDLRKSALKQKMTKYSKGMGQKIGLASGFLTEAPLLILDEPMSGLDPSARIRLKDTIQEYVKSGDKAIFFSSHILSDIDEVCDKIAVIHNSKLVFTGTPSDFKKKYKLDNLERAFLKSIEVE